MPDANSYIFEPELHPPHTYVLDAHGVRYRPPGGDPVAVRWEDIRYLEDVSGRKVDIVAHGSAASIPIFYGTRDFPGLLATICARLAEQHRDKLRGVRTFRGNRAYYLHSVAVLSVFAVLILGGLIYLHDHIVVWLLILAMTLPMAVFILLQPHTVIPREEGLLLRDYLRTRFIAYEHITAMAFDLLGDKHSAYLCIRVRLATGRAIKIQRLENLVLLFLYMKTKWACQRGKSAAGLPV